MIKEIAPIQHAGGILGAFTANFIINKENQPPHTKLCEN